MNTIVIHISDKVLAELWTVIRFKRMTGETARINDAVLAKILLAIEDEKEEVTVAFKLEKKGK